MKRSIEVMGALVSPTLVAYREAREFGRELKFTVPSADADRILDWARERLEPDPHGAGAAGDEYTVTTLALDTTAWDVFHRRGSFGRGKYRIRRYGDGALVYLERKLKANGQVAKTRSAIPFSELKRFEIPAGNFWEGQWFERRLQVRRLQPVCSMSYVRAARLGESAGGAIRLTLDRNLRASPVDRFRFDEGRSTPVGAEAILELKYRRDVPALFKQLIERFSLHPRAVSKYRLAVAALEMVPHA